MLLLDDQTFEVMDRMTLDATEVRAPAPACAAAHSVVLSRRVSAAARPRNTSRSARERLPTLLALPALQRARPAAQTGVCLPGGAAMACVRCLGWQSARAHVTGPCDMQGARAPCLCLASLAP